VERRHGGAARIDRHRFPGTHMDQQSHTRPSVPPPPNATPPAPHAVPAFAPPSAPPVPPQAPVYGAVPQGPVPVMAPTTAFVPAAAPIAPQAPIAPIAPQPVGVAPVAPVAPQAAVAPAVPADPWAPTPTVEEEWEDEPPTPLLIAAALAAYVLLAIWGMQVAGPSGVTDWFPAAGLAIAATALGGKRFLLVPFVGTLIATPLTNNAPTLAGTLVVAVTLSAVYGIGGLALRRSLDLDHPFSRVHDAWVLIGIGTVAVPVGAAIATIGGLIGVGVLPAELDTWRLVGDFVIGDALGIATVTPALFVASAAWRREPRLASLLPGTVFLRPESLAALVALVVATPVLYLLGGQDLRAIAVLPLCWLALRFGVVGAVIGAFTWAGSSAAVLSIVGIGDELGGLQGFLLTGSTLALIVGSVVSERERTQRALHHLAMHDQASGLPNEASLLAMLDGGLQSGREVTTMLVRFASLRQVAANMRREDTDHLVAVLVEQLQAIAGPSARVARPGFDRFAVVFAGGTAERRQQIGERIADELSAPISVESREVFVDPRVGITVGLPGEASDAVLAHADHASDTASGSDGHRVGYYDAAIERARRERHELTEDLRLATERGEFLLAFQPIVTAKEGRVVAAEALLRWIDKRRGPVSPADFVPVAEETGLILPIGRWVLGEACRRAAQWPHVGGQPIGVSVNISPIQLMDDGFVDDVQTALDRSGLPAERLRIEITEGIVLEDIERTIQQINQLREMGVETMLDDFGTGHSSLAWVQRLPVTCIKIDRAFVGDIAEDGIDRAIVHASLYLSRALGTETVAEGVETEAQREQLVRMGCQKLQGFLFARPQPADVFPDWLARQRARAAHSMPPIETSAPTAAHHEAWEATAAHAPASAAPRPYSPSVSLAPRPAALPGHPDSSLRAVPPVDPRFAA
jgi:EAL domain-containing protein (putative c-di-GMP-specific phosphodiesterase class I)/GGDEF domain-containing protein/integral membrane sensor domain MASE1